MIITLNTQNNNNSYDIVIERGAIHHIEDYINLNKKVLIITDSGVPVNYSKEVLKKCNDGYIYTIEQGESNKSIDNFKNILAFMIQKNFTRSDCVIAVGGGVVGDLGGFVSSCYMRGIDFYNIPTTLLSQVDSSIGGKTAINFQGVKNIIGSFYQPKKVIIDSNTLETLNDRLIHAGLVEAIKMATTYDKELFELIENTKNLKDDIDKIIYKSLLIKKMVVEEDPLEKSIRKTLNFGHTLGHAIEVLSNGSLYHGEAVGIGMLYFSSDEVRERLEKVLTKYDLPIRTKFTVNQMVDFIKHDKKAMGNEISCICVDEIGKCSIVKELIEAIITRGEHFE